MRFVLFLVLVVLSLGASAAAEKRGALVGGWEIFGDFGSVTGTGLSRTENGCRVETKVEVGEGGVELRATTLSNVSGKPLLATCLMDRFDLGGGEWEVYTQGNTWQHESRGAWHPLTTAVSARSGGMRTSYGAAPVLAVWNAQAGRGRVFHLLSDAAWEMRAERVPCGGENTALRVEVGLDSHVLAYPLAPGESVAFPHVLTYAFTNRADLDCHLLHAWWNARYPKKRLPVLYNSWLCRFDKLDADHVLRQVALARRIGCDYFVLDAGWFGPCADWASNRGDWEERPDGALKGRMGEVSEAVRKAGMKFGFWVEAESADPHAKVVAEHPDWFVKVGGAYFLDFRKREASAALLGTVCGLLKKYEASFLKFDFNQDALVDDTGRCFADYNAAYRAFVRAVRARNPGIYIEGCASGGLMMDLGWARTFDSFWLSDNQSPYHGLRIVRDTMLRLPPRLIERWIVTCADGSGQPNYANATGRILATDDATWTHLRSVSPSLLDAFTLGGTLGFSCDLTALPEGEIARWAKVVAERRAEGAFWANAVGRILCDTPSVLALQYSDAALREVRVVVAAERLRQASATIRPVVDAARAYRLEDGSVRTGADLMRDGMEVSLRSHAAEVIRLAAQP